MKLVTATLMAVVMGSHINAAQFLQADLTRQCDRVLAAIAKVESGNRDIGLHPDGVSYGKYGVTRAALLELCRVGILDDPNADLSDAAVNARVAREYLVLMFSRHGRSWWHAVGQYHGGSKEARDAYAYKVFAEIEAI